ncbi:hypothetical protein DCC62_23320 [candidate division KSB1 bacterium]|nr:MAG: hypothetical protein DCC62_23320 [candidate division KSB1 bacterium]
MSKSGARFLLALLLLGCETKPQNPLTQPEKFAEVYVALLKATQLDSLPAAGLDSLLQSRGYQHHQIQEAARYYREHAEQWQDVLNLTVQQLEREANPPAADSLATPKLKQPE